MNIWQPSERQNFQTEKKIHEAFGASWWCFFRSNPWRLKQLWIGNSLFSYYYFLMIMFVNLFSLKCYFIWLITLFWACDILRFRNHTMWSHFYIHNEFLHANKIPVLQLPETSEANILLHHEINFYCPSVLWSRNTEQYKKKINQSGLFSSFAARISLLISKVICSSDWRSKLRG